MDLTKETKEKIDSMSYEELLQGWRFSPAGTHWFEGETGAYWQKRMAELKAKDPEGAIMVSKKIGW